jgi:hypothetical protein
MFTTLNATTPGAQRRFCRAYAMIASATARGCSTISACAACGMRTTETLAAPNSSTSSLAADGGL